VKMMEPSPNGCRLFSFYRNYGRKDLVVPSDLRLGEVMHPKEKSDLEIPSLAELFSRLPGDALMSTNYQRFWGSRARIPTREEERSFAALSHDPLLFGP